jgi:ABC-type glycerol-3-phosphate transport system permease component
MKLQRGPRILIYLTLLIGAIAFSFPFVWLVSTSVKVDQELFTADLNIFPQQALPREVSPYFETRRLDALPGSAERQAEVLPKLRELVRERRPTLDEEGVVAVADEAYSKLASLAPADLFDGPVDAFLTFAGTTFTDAFINDLIQQRKRALLLGPIRVRSVDLQDVEVLADRTPAARWSNQPPDVATLVDDSTNVVQFARIQYDFTKGDAIRLSSLATTPFDASKLQRVQVRIQPDDTWHDVNFELQAAGRKYRAVRRNILAGYEWTTLTWQFPSADDTSNKIKTWTVLEDIGPATDTLAANQIKLDLFVDQTSELGAGYNKLIRNYERTLDHIPFWRYVRVSIFLVFANIALTLLFSSLVAYAFSRITWPGRDFCFILMLATMMIPGQVTMIPHFLIWKSVGAYNTLTPLWLSAAFGSAFFIFLLRQFMLGIPRDLEDAARLDGCGFLRIYWHVILPLVKPSLAAIAIFTFMGAWNDFLGPLIYIADQRLYSLAFGLYAFSVQVSNSPTLTMAASVLMVTPVIIVFFLAQKYFVEGVTLTGMKG